MLDDQEQLGSEQLMKTSSPRTFGFTLPGGRPKIGTLGDKSSVRQRSDRSSSRRRRRIIHVRRVVHLNVVLEHYTSARTLRSFDTNLLSVSRIRTCFGSSRSFFSAAALTLWNSLPFDIRNTRCFIKRLLFVFFHNSLK